MFITQIVIACTMFYCTAQTTTPYVQYTENIASCIDGPQNWYYLKNIRVVKGKGKFTARVVMPGQKTYYTKCDMIK